MNSNCACTLYMYVYIHDHHVLLTLTMCDVASPDAGRVLLLGTAATVGPSTDTVCAVVLHGDYDVTAIHYRAVAVQTARCR